MSHSPAGGMVDTLRLGRSANSKERPGSSPGWGIKCGVCLLLIGLCRWGIYLDGPICGTLWTQNAKRHQEVVPDASQAYKQAADRPSDQRTRRTGGGQKR